MQSMQPLNPDHERVRRELWAAIYRQSHEATVNASALRVEPEFRWAEAADRALTQFDKRFGTAGVEVPRG
jgi:hypothetical protein